ncbi:ABC transporter [Scardovia inopinata]|uniref:ABC transporter domain-containing protein n=1 Tax=Scardovia inopinata F0304 TaxID=641146 RepID=W5IHW1_SCAIO|nr:ATP-binding cassette domain-containing protein [Scardovia inopinata]EFG26453.1 hypothetical protein HMPREF9020_00072 [Scardovia inopinata F0304]BAR07493.1 ABC transporter ATP-binding component [Scardovia inopinata JCM 12537]SUV51566.1 ABC transporter [Scardovia inopinata]
MAEVELGHVSFSYGSTRALKDITLSFDSGLYGLLGPNGAGKTTLMNLLTTLARPSEGSLIIHGYNAKVRSNVSHIRSAVGYLPQSFELMNASSIIRNVSYAAWAHGFSLTEAARAANLVIHDLDLDDYTHTPVRKLSGGTRQRVGIACAMVTQPDLLVLDEPTVGLEPIQRIQIRKLLDTYAQKHTVILSTHLVDDLAAMADQVIVLSKGRILLKGTMDDLAFLGDSDDKLSTIWESGYKNLLTTHGTPAGEPASQATDAKKD